MSRMLQRLFILRRRKMLHFVEPLPHLQISRCCFSTNTNTSDIKEAAEAYGHYTSSSYGIYINGELQRLCDQGRLNEALHVLQGMERQGIGPHSSTYPFLLDWCIKTNALDEGKLLHAHMIDLGFSPDIFQGTKLVTMYAKCGNLANARQILEKMPERNVVSWTAMIAAYVRNGYNEDALELYYEMQRDGIQPNKFTFSSVIPACANLEALNHGKEVHEDITRNGFESDIVVGSTLVDMYAKCGSLEDARKVFDEMSERNVVSWTAMIAGYAQNGKIDDALNLFRKMPERDVASWNALITGYAKLYQVDEALYLFQKMPERNVASWTAMIAGYAQNGQVDAALKLFQKMPERDLVSWNAMIAGCAQNGYVDEALKLFQKVPERNAISWTAILAGCTENEQFDEALKLFRCMQITSVKPDSVTFASVLPACAALADLKRGKEIHGNVITYGFQSHIYVGSALVDMYGRCQSIEDACKVFDKMPVKNIVLCTAMIAGYAQNGLTDESLKLFQKIPERDVVSWNVIVGGCSQNGHFNEALKLFRQMQQTGVKPDFVTFTSVLPACANLASLIYGRQIHESIIRNGFESHLSVRSALVDMYAKCGTIESACRVFDKMSEGDVVSWNVMIVGYAKHGYGKEALQLFEQMQHSGEKANQVTFIGVLLACSHAGLVDDGWRYFERMSEEYQITPTVEHYCCVVDLLCRAGRLDEAQDFINKMPMKPSAAVWGSLLGACRIHANIELGERVAERLFELEPENTACYVLLSNIYAAAGRWNDVKKVRKLMKDRGIKKTPGCSWIEVNNKVYSFLARDKSHPETNQIYAVLERLSWQMEEAGYVAETNVVLHDVEEEQKEHIIGHHSEKLAIAFGLIHMCPGMPIRIIKNLRVCVDCHSATKFISKITAREIVIRDANRFHHFKDGRCSCGDFW